MLTHEAATFTSDTGRTGAINGVPYVERQAVMFEAGTHKGYTYTEDDLDKMVASFRAPEDDADVTLPVQLDHSSSARDTVGSVRRVWREGARLLGVVRVYGQEAVEKVQSGVWRRLSIAHRGDLSLREVTITPFPHLEEARMFQEGGAMSKVDALKKKAEEAEEAAEGSADNEEEEAAEKPAEKKKMSEKKQPAAAAHSETPDDKIAQFKAEFESQYGERIRTLEAENAKLQSERHFAECASLVRSFGESGKTIPAMSEAELKLVQTFSSEQLDLYKAVKSTQPALVQFDRLSRPAIAATGQTFGADELAAAGKTLAERYRPAQPKA